MVRLRALGSNTESGVPYTDEEINAMARNMGLRLCSHVYTVEGS
ncbi:hypothetical protein Tco_0647414, partial [Tanacetum coccineum]